MTDYKHLSVLVALSNHQKEDILNATQLFVYRGTWGKIVTCINSKFTRL